MPWEVPITVDGFEYPTRFNTDQEPTQEDIDEAVKQITSKRTAEKPFLDISDTLSATGRAVTSLGTTVPSSLSQAWAGLDNPWKRSEGYLQSQQGMRDLQEEMAAADTTAAAEGDASSVSSAIREATPSLGFSGATLAPSLAVGAGTALATRSPTAARGAAAATSAVMAYRMAGAQFLDDARDRINSFFQENFQRPPTEQEQEEAYQEILPLARKFGAAEAGPEALGNLALGGAGKYIRRALGGKGGIMELATGALGKVTGAKATAAGVGAAVGEIATEAVTKVEQDRIQKQFEEGTMLGKPASDVAIPDRTLGDYTQAFTDVAPTTLALTGLMGAAGLGPTAISKGYNALRTPTVATPPPIQPATADVAANVAATDEGGVAPIVTPDVGTPVTLDGQNYTVSIPTGSPISPDALAGFYDDPETLQALHESGRIRLEQVIAPTETVDTTPLNNNIASSAPFAPQVTKAMTEIADEEAAAEPPAPISQPAVTPAQETPVAPAESDGGSLGQMTPAAGGSSPDVTAATVPQEPVVSSAEIALAGDPFAAVEEPVVEEPVQRPPASEQTFVETPGKQWNWEVTDQLGGTAYGRLDKGVADIVGMESVPQGKKYSEEGDRLKRRGFFRSLVNTLKGKGARRLKISMQSADTRKALARLVETGELTNPREMAGISVDEHPTLFDIPQPAAVKPITPVDDTAITAQDAGMTTRINPDPERMSQMLDFEEVVREFGYMWDEQGGGIDNSQREHNASLLKAWSESLRSRWESKKDIPEGDLEKLRSFGWANAAIAEVRHPLNNPFRPVTGSISATDFDTKLRELGVAKKERDEILRTTPGREFQYNVPAGRGTGRATSGRTGYAYERDAANQELQKAWAKKSPLATAPAQPTPEAPAAEPSAPKPVTPKRPKKAPAPAEIAPADDPFVAEVVDDTTSPAITATPEAIAPVSEVGKTSGTPEVAGSEPAQAPVVEGIAAPKPVKPKRPKKAPAAREGVRTYTGSLDQVFAEEPDPNTRNRILRSAVRKAQSDAELQEVLNRIQPQQESGNANDVANDVLVHPRASAETKERARALYEQAFRELEQPIEETPAAPTPLAGPLRPKFEKGETVAFKENGQPVMGTVDEVNGDLVTVIYNWNGKSEQRVIKNRSQVQRPVLAVAEEPNYKYTQEQNARKAARFGLPTEPGVTVGAGSVIKNALARIASDTAMPQMLRAVARSLQNQNYDGVDLRIEADGRRWYAGYYLNDNGITEIGINLRLVGRGQVDAVSVLLHEALHHVTLAKVRDPQGEIETQAVEALDTLRKRIKVYAGLQQKATKFSYELGTVDEFITALFTRPDFQDFIAGIPDTFTPGTPGSKFRSVLSEIFRVIAQLVTGQKVQKGGILDQSFASTLALFETPQRAARGQSVDYTPSEDAGTLTTVEIERIVQSFPRSDNTESIPNVGSVSASLGEYREFGVRDVPIGYLIDADNPQFPTYFIGGYERTMKLANSIEKNGIQSPLILVWENEEYPYVLEGSTRYDALRVLAAQKRPLPDTVPALTVIDDDASRQSATDDTTNAEPTFTPDEARAILTKRFGKAVADKFNIEVMAPRRMGNREVEVDAELRGGTISLNLKFMESEELLIQKAEHEMAHAVFSDKSVQDAWQELSVSMPPDVRTRITERMKEAGYDYRVLNEEVLVRFLEEVRANTSPSKWKAFMDAVIDAFRRFFGAMPDERTARLAAARIIAAGEAAVARGLDPSKQAFGQSVATPRDTVPSRKYPGMIGLEQVKPHREVIKEAQEAITRYKKASESKDKIQVLIDARNSIIRDPDLSLSTKAVALDLMAQQGSVLADLAQRDSDSQVALDDYSMMTASASGVLESDPAGFANFKFTTIDELMKMASEAGRTLNIWNAIARLTPEGFLRSQERIRTRKVNQATEQQFGATNVMSEIEKLWRMMQEAGATDRGLAIAAALKAFMPSRKNAAALIAKLFPQAGIRDRMTKGGEALVRDFFQMMAGPRDPKGPLAEFDESIQSALSSMLRKVMEARGLVADNQTVQATDIDKLVRSVSADPLRFDKIAAADAAMQDELAKIEDDERRATLQQAWEEATSKMYTNVANDATLRRAVNAELKGEGVRWNEMFDKGQKPAALRAKVVDAVMTKVGALITGQTDPTAEVAELEKRLQAEADTQKQKQLREQIVDVRAQANALKNNLASLRSEVGAAFDFIAETKRVQWLAYRAGVEARRRVAERRKDMLAALRNRGVAESALMRLNEKMAGPQRPGAEPNAVTTLIGEHIKTPVDGFIDKLVALGVDQPTAEALDAISGTVRADLAKLAEANAVKRLTESLKPKTRAAKSAIPRLLRVLLEAGKTGAFDSKAFNDALGEAFDFPPMTAEQEAEIKRMVTEINKLPQGAARVDKQQELQNYVALVQGVPARDMLLSALYANWLSGLSTQAIGLAGNSANMGLRSFFLFLTSHPEDFANYLRGALGAGLRAGAMESKAALGSFSKLVKNEPEQVRGQFKVGKLDNPEIANALEVLLRKGPSTPAEWVAYIASFGTRMRAVFRVMSAIDTLFWNSAREGMYHLAASRTARKTAKEKGMTKEEANAEFIRQLGGGPEVFEAALKDAEAELKKAGQPADMLTMTRMAYEAIDKARVEVNPEAVTAANRFAFRMVLQQEPEGSGKLISKLISVLQKELNVAGFPLGQMLVPYNKIVSNLFEQSLDYTGLGLVRWALGMHISDARIDWSRKGMPGIAPVKGATMFSETEARERAMAGFVGLTLSAAAYVAAKANMDDDDDEVPFMIYAFGPTDKNKREQMPDGWSPFSIKIGNTYYRYAEWPLGMVLAGFGAALDAERYGNMKEKDTLDRIGYSAMLGLKGFMTQGVLSNVDTAIDVIMFKATGKKYTDIPVNAAKGLIPAQGALRDISRMFDNTKISNDDVTSALIKDIPVVKSWGTKPELNVFGEPVMQDGVAVLSRFVTQRRPHAEADYLTRNKLYIPGMDETVTIGQYLPPTERDRFKRRAMQMDAMENGVFTAEQNYNFRKRAGELTKSAVQRVMKQAPAVKTEEQRKSVQNLIDKQVGLARRRAMIEAVPYQPPPAQ